MEELRLQMTSEVQQRKEAQLEAQVLARNHQAMTLQLHTTVQMLLNIVPLARKVYGAAADDFLSGALAQATGGAPPSCYPSDPTSLRRKSSPVQLLKTQLQHSVLAHGCVQKWANSTPSSALAAAESVSSDAKTNVNASRTEDPSNSEKKARRAAPGDLEITLCYGVQCLARTFSLKGISCNELRAITSYDTAKTRDFYVRNASQPIGREAHSMHNEQVGVRAKPSHSWRDGEVEMPDFPESSGVAEAATKEKNVRGSATGEAALYSLPPPFDEIDFHTKLLGKQFVDLAWKIFAGREGAQISTRQELEEKFVRVNQRKVPTTIPALELPVASFAEFLGAYVTESVRQSHRTGHGADDDKSDSEEDVAVNEKKSIYGRRSSVTDPRRRSASTPRAAMGNTKSQDSPPVGAERKQRPLHPSPSNGIRHRYLVRFSPELDARRQKILRVKKTQSQRMAETLARARLAEYDARRELQDVRDRRLGPKKMPISEITKGTLIETCLGVSLALMVQCCCLEIVDDFMKSPLMDKFGRENLPASSGLQQPTSGDTDQRAVQKDPLKEELYGTAALDSSFVGCKPAPEPRRRSESRRKQLRRSMHWMTTVGL
ncbi:hypothetical protein GQ600_2211 [Phytophthora cactorum]|nr:hypothetical protein GQ600_2211 [Phytophthora cactorum]